LNIPDFDGVLICCHTGGGIVSIQYDNYQGQADDALQMALTAHSNAWPPRSTVMYVEHFDLASLGVSPPRGVVAQFTRGEKAIARAAMVVLAITTLLSLLLAAFD
jgi:hypothetical protein